jgi:hypothetical protein
MEKIKIGQSEVFVSRIGIGAMTWGDPSLSPRFSPARMAYGPAGDKEELQKVIEISQDAGVNFIDTAARDRKQILQDSRPGCFTVVAGTGKYSSYSGSQKQFPGGRKCRNSELYHHTC